MKPRGNYSGPGKRQHWVALVLEADLRHCEGAQADNPSAKTNDVLMNSFCGAGKETQGLVHPTQALYQLSYTFSLC